MSKLEEIAANWTDPAWWPKAMRKFVTNRLVWTHYELNKDRGMAVMEEDWDTLVVLDACRYDMFADLNTIEGDLERRYSKGSCTPDFLRENFTEGEFHDTVYVTANPMYLDGEFEEYDIAGRFHDTVDVWRTDWDEEHGTIRPAPVAEAAIDAFDRYPNKRHVVHFMQPHRPFIGDIGRRIEGQSGMATRDRVLDASPTDDGGGERAWKLVEDDEVSVERAWEAYRENLELVLPHARAVVDHHDGRRVVTSDHGNLVDEPVWPFLEPWSGHPPRTWTEELVAVPWLVVDGEARRTVTAEPPVADERPDESADVAERLRDLGYAQ